MRLRLPSPFLVAFLLSLACPPLAGYSLFYSLLVTEIIPIDQVDLPIPSVGDKVTVYGVWVQDTELTEIGVGGWWEIHPVRYIEINGEAYGEMPYTADLFEGVWSPARLIVQDIEEPYRIANGTVAEVFASTDGDYHVHVNVDEEYLSLLRPNIFVTSLPLYQILKVLSLAPIVVLALYVTMSLIRPERTYLGRVIKRRKV
ncbi:MAG: hypothetical protein ACRD5H_06190 [Nitrososphaerales archaeon]